MSAAAAAPDALRITTELGASDAMLATAYLVRGCSHHDICQRLALDAPQRVHVLRLCSLLDKKRFERKQNAVLLQLSHAREDDSFGLSVLFPALQPTLPDRQHQAAHGPEEALVTPPAAKKQRHDKEEPVSTAGESSGGSTDSKEHT